MSKRRRKPAKKPKGLPPGYRAVIPDWCCMKCRNSFMGFDPFAQKPTYSCTLDDRWVRVNGRSICDHEKARRLRAAKPKSPDGSPLPSGIEPLTEEDEKRAILAIVRKALSSGLITQEDLLEIVWP